MEIRERASKGVYLRRTKNNLNRHHERLWVCVCVSMKSYLYVGHKDIIHSKT